MLENKLVFRARKAKDSESKEC